jgi:hypothetical protein
MMYRQAAADVFVWRGKTDTFGFVLLEALTWATTGMPNFGGPAKVNTCVL